MNEPKRRGRPPKVRAQEPGTVPHVNGDTSREPGDVADEQSGKAQAYAMRVWAGQSPDAPRPWRIERVKLALEGQGLSMEGVELP